MTTIEPDDELRSEVIDYLGIEHHSGHVVLTLADDLDWGDERAHLTHLTLLRNKINRYFDFIESGEAHEQASRVAKRTIDPDVKVEIRVLFRLPPPGRGLDFREHVSRAAEEVGVGFSFKVLEADDA